MRRTASRSCQRGMLGPLQHIERQAGQVVRSEVSAAFLVAAQQLEIAVALVAAFGLHRALVAFDAVVAHTVFARTAGQATSTRDVPLRAAQ